MWDTSLALLFLAAGYLFVSRWTVTRTASLRSTQHPQYFYAAIAAAAMYFLAAMAIAALRDALPWLIPFVSDVSDYVGEQIALPEQERLVILKRLRHFAVALMIAWILPTVLNRPFKNNHRLMVAILSRFNAFTRLEQLVASMLGRLPLMFTQSNGKVYIGYVVSDGGKGLEVGEWLRIEPFLSGYRDDQNRFFWTTDYMWLHHKDAKKKLLTMGRTKEDFEIVISMPTITAAHPFDMNAYYSVFSKKVESPDGSKTHHDSNNQNLEAQDDASQERPDSPTTWEAPEKLGDVSKISKWFLELRVSLYLNDDVQRMFYRIYVFAIFTLFVIPAYGGWLSFFANMLVCVVVLYLTKYPKMDQKQCALAGTDPASMSRDGAS
ncbi:MAG: hypothetical protein IT475_01825 [Aquimonas sp.]|nr:hypothetical protein [Aquimonas sp.]